MKGRIYQILQFKRTKGQIFPFSLRYPCRCNRNVGISVSDDIRLAIIVSPDLPLGLIANTVGAVAIGLGARIPALGADELADRQARRFDISANRPVPVLQADGGTIRAIMLKALSAGEDRAVVPFPAFARSLHVFADYREAVPGRDLAEEAIDGLGLAGPSKWIRSLTGSLKLLR